MSKLAIIYKKEEAGVISFYGPTRVDIYSNKIKILEGSLKGVDNSFFGLLEGDPEYIEEDINPTFTIDKEVESGYYLFIFEDSFIKEYSKTNNIDEKEATYKIISLASYTNFFIDKVFPRKLGVTKSDMGLSYEEIKRLFEAEIKNSSKGPINYPLSIMAFASRDYNEEIQEQRKSIERITKDVDIKKIIDEISNKIIEQEASIRTVACNIYFNQKLIDSLDQDNDNINNELDSRKVGILLDGATGVGKTALAKEISSKFNLPIVIENANSFSETGYVGATITDILGNLLKKAKGNLELAQRGIVFLDEVDKIAKKNEYDDTSMKLGVQKELLGFMSGGTYEIEYGMPTLFGANKISFDTSKLTFIFAGAFTDMKEQKIEENNKNSIGFTQKDKKDNSYSVDAEDYIKFGLMREFFGRIKVISHMKTYTKEDLKKILFESTISPLSGLEKTCIMFGAKGIKYDESFIDSVVDKAYNMGTNARALQSIMSSIQNILLYSLETGEYIDNYIELDKTLLDEIEKEKIIKY